MDFFFWFSHLRMLQEFVFIALPLNCVLKVLLVVLITQVAAVTVKPILLQNISSSKLLNPWKT